LKWGLAYVYVNNVNKCIIKISFHTKLQSESVYWCETEKKEEHFPCNGVDRLYVLGLTSNILGLQ
jgi:hypothetical protein